MSIGVLTIHLQIPGCNSLKEKRSKIKPLLARLHREFNVSAAELDRQDAWQETIIGCALISNQLEHISRSLQVIPGWIESHFPDFLVLDDQLECL